MIEFILLAVLIVSMLALSFLRSKRLDEPHKIILIQWFIMLLLYNVLKHQLFPLTAHFYIAVGIWIIAFFIGSFTSILAIPKLKFGESVNATVVKIFFFIIVASLPFIARITYANATDGITEHWALNLRLANTGIDEDAATYGVFVFAFPLANLTLFLIHSNKQKFSKFFIISILIINILFALITMAKTAILFTLIPLLFIKRQKQVKVSFTRKILLGAIFALFMIALNVIRSADVEDQASSEFVENQVLAYTLSSITAFDQLQFQNNNEYSDKHFGAYTFRFFYATASSLGLIRKEEVVPTIQEYVDVPVMANVYTVMFPFYQDFGLAGLLIFGVIVGSIFGLLYKWRGTSSMANIIFLALVPQLFFQYFNEFLFANVSYTLQIVLLALVAHFPKISFTRDVS